MNRSELAVTIAGLIATFFLPWPQGEEPHVRHQLAGSRPIEAPGTGAHLTLYEDFGRVRPGPTAGIQPTR